MARTDRPAEARKEFEETIRINPDDYKAHGNLGLIAMELGDRTAAIRHLETALKLNPTDQLCKDALRELTQRPAGQ